MANMYDIDDVEGIRFVNGRTQLRVKYENYKRNYNRWVNVQDVHARGACF